MMSHKDQNIELDHLREEIDCLRSALTRAEEERHKLSESEAFYRRLVELAADTILMGDHTGNIVGANQSATDLTGYPRNELLGQSISFFFSEEERQKSPLRYDLLKEGKVVQTERELTRKDGTTVPVSMNSKMMPDGTYHTLIRDFTAQKRLEAKMLEANRDLEAFVYTVSHDLRTPLTPIIGFAEMLTELYADVMDEQGLLFLANISESGTGMLDLIDDLLLFASIGELERPDVAVSTVDVVEEVVRALETEIAAAGVVVQVDTLPSIHMPQTFLKQIFNNLITNSLRYAGEENRTIKVWGELDGTRVRFYVRDHGQGVAEHERTAVFDAFYRGTSVDSSKGAGLGLSIVQKIARNYGGDVSLEETNGAGCLIKVEMDAAI